MTPVVRSQRQADAILLSNAFGLVPHNLLLHKLSSFGLSDRYVSWLSSYLTNRQSQVRISGTLSLPFKLTSGVPQGSSLMTYVTQLTIVNFKSLLMISKFPVSLTLRMIASYSNLTLIL
jgi:hypothetical protein